MTRRRLTRQQIVEAAADIAVRHGTTAVTMRSVAKAVGCEAMSLYTYVGSAADLWVAMVEHLYGPKPAELLARHMLSDEHGASDEQPLLTDAADVACRLLVLHKASADVDELIFDVRMAVEDNL